jgi:hypothetical protein
MVVFIGWAITTLITLCVIYWVIRLAVRHALEDVHGPASWRDSPSPNSPRLPGQ